MGIQTRYLFLVIGVLLLFATTLYAAQGKDCMPPGHGAHSFTDMTSKSVPPGTIVNYDCDKGYQILGSSRRFCHNNGSWSGKAPVCAINIARHRIVYEQSDFVDQQDRQNSRSLLDDYFSSCSIAENAEMVPAIWTIDLLEVLSFNLIQVVFGDGLKDVKFDVYYGNSPSSRIPVPLEGELSIHSLGIDFEMVPKEIIVYDLPLRTPVTGRYVKVHVWSQPGRYRLPLCEVMIFSSTAPSSEQCRHSLLDKDTPVAVIEGKCFSFHRKEKLEWNDAGKRCGAFNASLVTEIEEPVQKFLVNVLHTLYDPSIVDDVFWVGGYQRQDFVEEGTMPAMKYLNDSATKYFQWTKTYSGVSGVLDSCLTVSGDKENPWQLKNCLSHNPWICQYDIPFCGSPERKPQTILNVSNKHVGEQAYYSCPDGYVLKGPSVRTCLHTGQWSNYPPICLYVNCGDPEPVDNATVKLLQNTTTYGSAIEYACVPESLHMSGSRHRVCENDGTWSGELPICSEEIPDPERHTALMRWEVLLGVALGCMLLLLIVTVITFIIIYSKKQSGTHYIREPETKTMLARFDSDDSLVVNGYSSTNKTGLIYAYENGKSNGKV